jgi:hypothetical protein
MTAFFTRNELDALSRYLDMPVPEGLEPLPDSDAARAADDGSESGGESEAALQNRVARIALSVIQERLPQCGIFDGSGSIQLTRQPFPKLRRGIILLPQFLFMINWADTAPGISWPESYHATYVPGFDCYVVTASMDGTDVWGYEDLAIGSFTADTEIGAGSRVVITDWWQSQWLGWEQQRWAYVWEAGLIDVETANEWADEVWNPPREEDEYEDEFEEGA